MESWFRLPLAVRVVLIISARFSYAVAILALDAADIADSIARAVGVACPVGLGHGQRGRPNAPQVRLARRRPSPTNKRCGPASYLRKPP